jgi:peptide/nickel transport system substrate-binding protein
MAQRDTIQRVIHDYRSARISRREVMKRGLALGLSVPAIAALLANDRSASAAGGPSSHHLTAGDQDQPKTGGTLREGYDLDFSRMDPINTNWYDPGFYALYEHIITLDPDGKYVPQLAESWEVAPDGLSVTFHIRSGVKFHSGAPLDAAAIKAEYDVIIDPKGGASLGSLFAPVASNEVPGMGNGSPVAGTATPDANTLIVHLKHPYADIFNVVSTGYWAIANMAVRAQLGADYATKVVDGSGPFTLVDWIPGDHVSVQRWDDYAGSIVPYFQNKGKAYLDGIKWTTILEAAQRAVQIENSEIDAVHAPAFQDVSRLEGNSDLNIVRLKEWSGYIFGVNFQRTDLDFQDERMRQAISGAIDRASIATALLFGEGEPLYGPITTADRYYTTDVEQYNKFDLATSKATVASLGWTANADGILEKNGKALEINLVIQAESFNQQLGQVLQDQLKQLGIKVTVQALDRGTYFGELAKGPDSYLFYYAWPVPIDVVTLFVSTATIPNPNWAHASIPEVDAAIAAWQSAPDDAGLKAAAAQFQTSIAQHLPIIPLVNRNSIFVNRKTVHGYLPHQWNLYPYYNDVWLE